MIKWIVIFSVYILSNCFAEEFYQSRQWLNLLYYEKVGPEYHSVAADDHFFVSPLGKKNPKLEYEASLRLTREQDTNFRQNFPLRYKSIAQANHLPYYPLVTPNEDITSVVVAFPNRYMANPASMFGHLFIILKSKRGLMDSDILHYLADTAGTNQSAYIYNGLTGKFKGWFLREPYYKKIKDYNYVEDREITYYDLKLSTDQIQNLQLHAVELKQSYFPYYFLDENCAFFMGKLLNTVLDEDIISKTNLIFPSQIINNLQEKSLLTSEYRRKASTKLFNENFNCLNQTEQSEVISLITHETDNPTSNKKILKPFLYISENMINNHSDLAQIIRHNRIQSYKILSKEEDVNIRPVNNKQNTVSPIKSKGLSIGYGYSNQTFLSYSPIYYSEYESFGDPEQKKLSCLTSRLILSPVKPPLYELTLADISSISQYNIVLNTYSWKLNSSFAYQSEILANNSFELGKALHFFDQGITFGFLGLNFSNYDVLSEQKLDTLRLTTSLSLGIEQNFINNTLNTHLIYDYKYNKNYISTKISCKALDLIHQITYTQSENFKGIKFSSTATF